MFHSSGRWFLGSHPPKSSRNEKIRSLARARSSSRRGAPAPAACTRPSLAACRGVRWWRVGGARGARPPPARAVPAVVDVPQRGRLVLVTPPAEVVAEREDPLLGPRALLVAAGAAERGVELVLLDRVEQRRRLQAVAGRARAPLLRHA